MSEIKIKSMVKKDNLEDSPKVSFKVRKYVWSYLFENLLVSKKIMIDAKYDYDLMLSLNKLNPEIHKFFQENPFNDGDNKFDPECKFNIQGNLKFVVIRVVSKKIDGNTTPKEYADIVYDAFGSFLILISKKVKKEDFDKLKFGLDYDFINSFPFPASMEECDFFIF